MQGPLLAFLYTTRFFAEDSFRTEGVLGQSMRPVGPARVLQNRVLPRSCTVRNNVEGVDRLFSKCYGPYSTSDRQESYFGPLVNDTAEDTGCVCCSPSSPSSPSARRHKAANHASATQGSTS